MLALLRELPLQYLLIIHSDKLHGEHSILGHLVAGGRNCIVEQEVLLYSLDNNYRQSIRECMD